MLVRKGLVQRFYVQMDGQQVKAWPVAQTLEDAQKLMKYLNVRKGVRAAEIGSVQGETLEGHINLAMNEGCKIVCCVLGWTSDGAPEWGYMPIDE